MTYSEIFEKFKALWKYHMLIEDYRPADGIPNAIIVWEKEFNCFQKRHLCIYQPLIDDFFIITNTIRTREFCNV